MPTYETDPARTVAATIHTDVVRGTTVTLHGDADDIALVRQCIVDAESVLDALFPALGAVPPPTRMLLFQRLADALQVEWEAYAKVDEEWVSHDGGWPVCSAGCGATYHRHTSSCRFGVPAQVRSDAVAAFAGVGVGGQTYSGVERS
jgi:hypothetical protein